MKSAFILYISISLLLACNDPDPEVKQHTAPAIKIRNMKGFEIYVWNADGKTLYTLLPGTNRNKDSAEIYDPTDAVEWAEMRRKIDEIEQEQYVSIKLLRADSIEVIQLRKYLESKNLTVSMHR